MHAPQQPQEADYRDRSTGNTAVSAMTKAWTVMLIVLAFTTNRTAAQEHYHNIDSLLLVADSVVVKSHVDLIIPAQRIPSATRPGRTDYISEKRRTLFQHNDLIDSFLVQRKLLSTSEKQEVIRIITTYESEENYSAVFCYDPHQAIIFYLGTTTEYIDLCFDCHMLAHSKGIWMENRSFSFKQWKKLAAYMVSLHIDYKIKKR